MKRFAQLYLDLDASTSTLAKLAAMQRYFGEVDDADAAWATYVLAGGKPRQVVPVRRLAAWACEQAGVQTWLFDECYAVTGDLAETIAYLLPDATTEQPLGLAPFIHHHVLALRALPEEAQRAQVLSTWASLSALERFLHIKLIGGGLRVGVSRLLLQRALAQVHQVDAKVMAQRLIGYTAVDRAPTAADYAALRAPLGGASQAGHPYPFYLAHALEGPPEALGSVHDWLAEWKYDGIRAQVIKRAGQVWVWTRGEELVTERYPEVVTLARGWPDGTVVDGELLAWREGEPQPLPFAVLQQRIGRKTLGTKLRADAPVTLLGYDLLEFEGVDLRGEPFHARRHRLDALGQAHGLRVSPLVPAIDWTERAQARAQSRERGVEGLMLKHRDSVYGAGRTKAAGIGWWKWKVDPMRVDAILIYAQAGHGRRANVYTDYTFAVWNRAPRDAEEVARALDRGAEPSEAALQLVPFAKAYSGLTDQEFARVDRVVRRTTVEKFGPVRKLRPTLVFELGFEGLARSTRHKSGVATRFPRMLRWREDKPLHEADTMATLEALLGDATSP